MIVGGRWGDNPKPSSVVRKLSHCFDSFYIFNGEGSSKDLPSLLDYEADLILWMPDIDNEEKKFYPYKTKGQVLICSKVMREGYTKMDAISRIFAMHGNAVIAITKPDDQYVFELIDALGNTWFTGSDIQALAEKIREFYNFTKSAIRIGSEPLPNHSVEMFPRSHFDEDRIEALIDANDKLSADIMTQCGNRFFGNISTRCQKLFPSLRGNTGIFVSPRNSDKSSLTARDLLLCHFDPYKNKVIYHNGRGESPSVDTPVQLKIYRSVSYINFMIHGHAFLIDGDYNFCCRDTTEYFLCGDVREADEVLATIDIMDYPRHGIINLKNHGFLMFSDTLEAIQNMIAEAKWRIG